MIRNLKVLGLAVAAVFAMSAVVASAASAAPLFHAASSPTILTGTQTGNHVFDAASDTITCKKASFNGTVEGTAVESIKAEAAYSECSFFGVNVAVNMNACQYEFNANGEVAVVNKTGKSCSTEPISFKASFLGLSCTVKVGPQANLNSATYDGATVEETNGTVTVTPAVNGISYTQTGSGCGSHNEGQYTSGSTLVKGFADSSGTEGAQKAIWRTP